MAGLQGGGVQVTTDTAAWRSPACSSYLHLGFLVMAFTTSGMGYHCLVLTHLTLKYLNLGFCKMRSSLVSHRKLPSPMVCCAVCVCAGVCTCTYFPESQLLGAGEPPVMRGDWFRKERLQG